MRKDYAQEAEKVIQQIHKEAREESHHPNAQREEIEMIPKELAKPRTDLKNINRDLEI